VRGWGKLLGLRHSRACVLRRPDSTHSTPPLHPRPQALAAALARRDAAAAGAAALRRQAEEKAARDAALRESYANRVTASYFDQFGTSHR
jgi:hypothetical protein